MRITKSQLKELIKEEVLRIKRKQISESLDYSNQNFVVYQIDEVTGTTPVIIDISSLFKKGVIGELSSLGEMLIHPNSKSYIKELYKNGDLEDGALIEL
jgi:hypothetical protein